MLRSYINRKRHVKFLDCCQPKNRICLWLYFMCLKIQKMNKYISQVNNIRNVYITLHNVQIVLWICSVSATIVLGISIRKWRNIHFIIFNKYIKKENLHRRDFRCKLSLQCIFLFMSLFCHFFSYYFIKWGWI